MGRKAGERSGWYRSNKKEEWQVALQKQCDDGTLLFAGAVVDTTTHEVESVVVEDCGKCNHERGYNVHKAAGRLARNEGFWQIGEAVPFFRICEAHERHVQSMKALAAPGGGMQQLLHE